eukprot:scaffold538_cov412-Prasinococcus_capsulatus_cf.AAC.17
MREWKAPKEGTSLTPGKGTNALGVVPKAGSQVGCATQETLRGEGRAASAGSQRTSGTTPEPLSCTCTQPEGTSPAASFGRPAAGRGGRRAAAAHRPSQRRSLAGRSPGDARRPEAPPPPGALLLILALRRPRRAYREVRPHRPPGPTRAWGSPWAPHSPAPGRCARGRG